MNICCDGTLWCAVCFIVTILALSSPWRVGTLEHSKYCLQGAQALKSRNMTRSIPTTIDLFGYICVLMKCGWRSIWIIPREDTHEDKMWGYDTLVFDDVSMNRYNLVFKLLRNHLHQLIRHLTKSPELSLRIGLYISKSSTSSLQQGVPLL